MRINKLRFFCFIMCGILFAPVLSGAFPYQPAKTIQLMSESAAGFSESFRQPDVSVWRVVPEARQPDGTLRLLFFRNMSDNQICKIVLSGSGAILEADIAGVTSNMIIREDDMLLIKGFPVPCDILPVQLMNGDKPEESKIYQVKRSAGTQTFVDTLEVVAYPVTYDAARANGWIKGSQNAEPSGLLQILKVIDQRTGDVVSMQLWESDAIWWLYEQTPFRQSWRLP